MTVNNTTSIISYAGNGSTTLWSFPFPGVDPSFIQVSITDNFGNVIQQPTNAYTVTLNPPIAPNPTAVGGTVLFPLIGPPLAVGFQITISRNLPATQTVSISNQSIVYPPIVEKEFDYLTLLEQQALAGSIRAFSVGPSDPVPALVPSVSVRANQNAFFDVNGNLTAGTSTAPGVIVSDGMIPVVSAATIPLAQVAMGVAPTASPVFTGDPQAPTAAISDNDASIATTAFVQALVASLTVFTTGDLKPTHKTVADAGWILWVDGTIGDGASGSSILASAVTQALFTLYYNSYSDTNCPILTSGGAATTRVAQGVALAAFNAHCRMSLPKGAGRALALAGTGSGLTARGLGSTVGVEGQSPTIGTMVSHNHNALVESFALTNQSVIATPNTGPTGFNLTDTFAAATASNGGGNPFPVMQPSTFVNVMVKL